MTGKFASNPHHNRIGRSLALVGVVLAVSACSTTPESSPDQKQSATDTDTVHKTAGLDDFRTCRDDALTLARKARAAGVPGRYLASARLLASCPEKLGPNPSTTAQRERMRVMALSVVTYLKGGHVQAATEELNAFETAYPNRDLYFANGASFVESMSVLVNQTSDKNSPSVATMNVPENLKHEIRRTRHWANN